MRRRMRNDRFVRGYRDNSNDNDSSSSSNSSLIRTHTTTSEHDLPQEQDEQRLLRSWSTLQGPASSHHQDVFGQETNQATTTLTTREARAPSSKLSSSLSSSSSTFASRTASGIIMRKLAALNLPAPHRRGNRGNHTQEQERRASEHNSNEDETQTAASGNARGSTTALHRRLGFGRSNSSNADRSKNNNKLSRRGSWNARNSDSLSLPDEAFGDDESDDVDYTNIEKDDDLTRSTASTSTTSCSTSSSSCSSSVSRHGGYDVSFVPASTLPGALEQWRQGTLQLLCSDDFQHFVQCSQHVVWRASCTVVHTALLPITLPLTVTRHTTHFMLEGCVTVVSMTGQLVWQLIAPQPQHNAAASHQPKLLMLESSSSEQPTNDVESQQAEQSVAEEEKHNDNCDPSPLESNPDNVNGDESNLLMDVLGVPWILLDAVNKVKDDLGHMVVHAVTAPQQQQDSPNAKPKKEQPPSTPNFVIRKGKQLDDGTDHDCGDQDPLLERLRLDYYFDTPMASSSSSSSYEDGKKGGVAAATLSMTSIAHVKDSSSFSKFLLPVSDLNLHCENDTRSTIQFVDLQWDNAAIMESSSQPNNIAGEQVVQRALQQLVEVGISLMANHPTVRLSRSVPTHKHLSIEWRPEGQTSKLLKKMTPQSSLDRLRTLEKEVLIWSGTMNSGSKFPFFLARGIVSKSPRQFLHLLWDNTRTVEYNNFCLGRTNLLVLRDDILSNPQQHTGTKVVQSETRVPFTSMSVLVSCVMHVRPLESPDEGYVIVSRSLHSGPAGTHTASSQKVTTSSSQNEILWGMNVLRRVPNHPHLTDLTSLSQVGSNLVPKFLATRIGMMGIEDFFKNVRSSTHHHHHSKK